MNPKYIDNCKPKQKFSHDAMLVYITEHNRLDNTKDENKSDSFLVSSDKALRFWDMQRIDCSYPVVIYPSQMFLLLIKVCGRSEDDMNSFVSFINIRNRSNQISPQKANIILSGISSITADVENQKILVGSVFDADFQNIIQNSNIDKDLYESTQLYTQRYLEGNLDQVNKARQVAEKERDIAISKIDKETKAAEHTKITLEKKNVELDEQKERICQFAEKQTKAKLCFVFYVVPTVIIILCLAFCIFIFLQFFYCDAPWNLMTKFFAYISFTTFGKGSSGPLYIIDLALFFLLLYIFKAAMKNPFDNTKKQAYCNELIATYINQNNLQ